MAVADQPVEHRRLHEQPHGVRGVLPGELFAQVGLAGQAVNDPLGGDRPLPDHLFGQLGEFGVFRRPFEDGQDQTGGTRLGGPDHTRHDREELVSVG